MATDVDELLREVATRHGLVLGRDDPILVVHTLHGVLLRDMAAEQHRLLEDFRREIKAAAQSTVQASGERVDRVLRDVLGSQREDLARVLGEAGEVATRRFDLAVKDSLVDIQLQQGRSRQLVILALLGTTVAWASAVATVAIALARH